MGPTKPNAFSHPADKPLVSLPFGGRNELRWQIIPDRQKCNPKPRLADGQSPTSSPTEQLDDSRLPADQNPACRKPVISTNSPIVSARVLHRAGGKDEQAAASGCPPGACASGASSRFALPALRKTPRNWDLHTGKHGPPRVGGLICFGCVPKIGTLPPREPP